MEDHAEVMSDEDDGDTQEYEGNPQAYMRK
jgi:hypothetical protein